MHIRPFTDNDLPVLKRLHSRQGFDYVFPDVSDPIFVSKLVLEDDDARIAMASLARLTCEMYLILDPSLGTPPDRFSRMTALHQAGERDLISRGLDDAHAWLPPGVSHRFGKRLEVLGWVRDDKWTPYCYRFDQNVTRSHSNDEVGG
ncbi:MAG TPA: hypothetical protein VJN69_14725 [Candidatus Acidoferrales bacterium]|nr:hypothetical protein [Candidatus Acidoferrales bacterium]